MGASAATPASGTIVSTARRSRRSQYQVFSCPYKSRGERSTAFQATSWQETFAKRTDITEQYHSDLFARKSINTLSIPLNSYIECDRIARSDSRSPHRQLAGSDSNF
jgi:hypothetical protein